MLSRTRFAAGQKALNAKGMEWMQGDKGRELERRRKSITKSR